MQDLQDIFQNQYGGLAPKGQTSTAPERSIEPERPIAPVMSDEDRQELQTQQLIERLTAQRENAQNKITGFEDQLKFDPIKAAHDRHRGLYKWKGVSTGRKLGSIGYGILDGLSSFGHKNAGERIREQEQQRFDNIKSAVPIRIAGQQKLIANINDTLSTRETARQKRQNVLTQIELKKVLDATSNPTELARINLLVSQLDRNNALTPEAVKNLGAKTENLKSKTTIQEANQSRPKNSFDAAAMISEKKPDGTSVLGENFMKNLGEMTSANAKGRGSRPPNVQYKNTGVKSINIKKVDGNFVETPFQEASIFDPAGNFTGSSDQRIKKILPPPGGRNFPVGGTEYKRFNDTRYAVDLFNQSVGALLNEIYTGSLDDRSLWMDTSIGRRLREMTTNEPIKSLASREAWNQGSLAAIQHVRSVTGGRAAAGFTTAMDDLLTAKGATATEKFASQITQKYTLEMALASMAGSEENNNLFLDPKFYDFLQKKSAALYNITKQKRVHTAAPSLDDIVKEYHKTRQASVDKSKSTVDMTPAEKQRIRFRERLKLPQVTK